MNKPNNAAFIMPLLKVKNVTRVENGIPLLNGTSFELQKNEKIAIAGETGSGKTSLLKIISGLIQASEGEVLFENESVAGPLERLIPGHPKIAYLSQYFELRNNYRVEEELECKNLLSDEQAYLIYKVCQVEHLLKRKTDQLSGGERQRIVLARLLTTSPRLLLLDEPFSNMDMAHKRTIKQVINDIGEQLGISCILVSHEPADTLSWADNILVMKEGTIVQQGGPEEIYFHPDNEYVAGLFGDYIILSDLVADYFSAEFNLQKTDKKILFRPEHFAVSTKEDYPVKGVVKKIGFSGSSYLLSVSFLDQELPVRVLSNNLSIGDKVSVIPEISGGCYFR